MPATAYTATVIGPEGVNDHTFQVETKQEARELAESYGAVTRIRKSSNGKGSSALNSFEREQLLEKLADLIAARVGTSEALRLIVADFGGCIKRVCQQLLVRLEAGDDLVGAIRHVGSPDFPQAIQAIVDAGYRAGNAEGSLREAAVFESELRENAKTQFLSLIGSAVGYFMAFVLTVGSVYYLAPQVLTNEFIKQAGDAVNVRWAEVSAVVVAWLMILITAGIVTLLVNRFVFTYISPIAADKLNKKIPLWRDIAMGKEQYLAFYTLSTLLSSGIEVEKAFELTADEVRPGLLKDNLQNAACAVREGDTFSDKLTLLTNSTRAAISTASDRRQIADNLNRISVASRKSFLNALKIAAGSLQGLSALFLIASGGLLFALTILPMLQATAAF